MATLTGQKAADFLGKNPTIMGNESEVLATVPKSTTPKVPSYWDRVKESVSTDMADRAKKTEDIQNRPDTGILSEAEKGIQTFGQGAGMASHALETTVGEIPGVKPVVQAVGKGIDALAHTSFIRALGDKIGGNKTLQEVVKAYDTDPNFKDTVDGVANVVRLGSDVDTGIAASKKVASTAAKLGTEVSAIASDIGNVSKQGVEKIINKVAPAETIDQTTGKVLQGKVGDIPSGREGLSQMETSKIKTYKELKDLANSTIKEKSALQDVNLAKDSTPRSLSSFEKTVGEGASAAKMNYVKEAIDNLKELYTKTSDAEGLAKINKLINKAEGEPVIDFTTGEKTGGGLTVKEINDLARMYGSEFGKKAFGKTGEALTSVNATKFENIRSGVKDTARELLPDEASKVLDKQMSDVYTVRDLAQKMEQKVNTLTQRLQKPNILQKVGGLIGKGMRITGAGDLASKLLGIDKVPGAATLNAVELEAQLSKNLGKINSALLKDDAGFIRDMKDLIQSESNPTIKNSPSTAMEQSANAGEMMSSMKNNNNIAIKEDSTSFKPRSQTGKLIMSAAEKYKSIPNKKGGFIKIGSKTFREIPDGTKREMIQAIDYLRLGKEVDSRMEKTLGSLAQKYNISQDLSNQKIANKFEELIENTKTSQ